MFQAPLAEFGEEAHGTIVQNDVDCLARRSLCLDGVQKADELLMPVTMHVATNNNVVEGGEQRCCAVTLAIMRHDRRVPRVAARAIVLSLPGDR